MASSEPNLPRPQPSQRDPWSALSRYTAARIAQGRAGGSYRTDTLLDFRLAHARARDAVMKPFEVAQVERQLTEAKLDFIRVSTQTQNRRDYLVNPSLGRCLSEPSQSLVQQRALEWGQRQLVVILSDGLSALAAERHAVNVLKALFPRLQAAGWTIFPVFLAPFARVGLLDEIGHAVRARHALILLGERPGLGAPDSLGAYFTFLPKPGQTDADRNCISNIRPEGLPPADAADKLAWMLLESERRQCSGIRLKESLPPPRTLE